MAQVSQLGGLDVHRASVVAATMDRVTGEMRVRRLSGETREVVAFCVGLAGPTRVAYEAGPTGFALSRALTAASVQCVIAAPGKIERPSSDRVKTDQRDAERLLRLLMIDGLLRSGSPAARRRRCVTSCVRARTFRGDLMRARHRMSKLLLRHDVRFDGTAATWTTHHRRWLAAVDLGDRGAQAAFMDYLGAIDALLIRRDTLEATIGDLIPGSPWAPTIWSMGPLPQGRARDELPRPRPVRRQHRQLAAAGRDHQDRQRAWPPTLGRSRVALPPPATQQRRAQAPPGRTARQRHRDQLAGAAATAPTWQRLGAERAKRSILDSGLSRRNMVLPQPVASPAIRA